MSRIVRQRLTGLTLAVALGMLPSSGCCKRGGTVLPDWSRPHELAAPVKCAEIVVDRPDGKVERLKVDIPAGYWVGPPPPVGGDR